MAYEFVRTGCCCGGAGRKNVTWGAGAGGAISTCGSLDCGGGGESACRAPDDPFHELSHSFCCLYHSSRSCASLFCHSSHSLCAFSRCFHQSSRSFTLCLFRSSPSS